MSETKCQLPQKIEQYAASLSKMYEVSGEKDLQAMLVNADFSLEEAEYDNWNGGQTGFLVRMSVPGELFALAVEKKDECESRLYQALGKLINIPGEYISSVSIEMSLAGNHDWREKSGLKVTSQKIVSADNQDRIWAPEYLRVFLSHKAEFKLETAKIQEAFGEMGISAFVAHNDIEPTAVWQTTIEEALFSMDVFVALLTDGFHDSNWTDQEVGIAIGREVPIISVRLGKDPYGFIGKYQGMPGMGKDMRLIANELFGIIAKRPEIKDRLAKSVVKKFHSADCWGDANWLIKLIDQFDKLSPGLIKMLEEAWNENDQVYGANIVKKMFPGVLQKFKEVRL